MTAKPTADLEGTKVQAFQVLDRAPRPRHMPSIRGACWWVRCNACREQQWEKATTIRKALRGEWALWCRACGAGKPTP